MKINTIGTTNVDIATIIIIVIVFISRSLINHIDNIEIMTGVAMMIHTIMLYVDIDSDSDSTLNMMEPWSTDIIK